MELQIEHIQHYPIGGENALRIYYKNEIYKLTSLHEFSAEAYSENSIKSILQSFKNIKPIFRPVSDLYREIDGKIGIVELAKIIDASLIWSVDRTIVFGEFWRGMAIGLDSTESYQKNFWFCNNGFNLEIQLENQIIIEGVPSQLKLFQWLFNNHYDVFDLISQGLAIDVNTI